MKVSQNLKAGLLVSLNLGATMPAMAQECALDVVTSGDAVDAQLTYYTDTGFTQAVIISNHAYSDGATIVVIGVTTCDAGSVALCTGVAVEGIAPGEERSYWFTEILRTGDDVSVTTSGFRDPDLTQPLAESVYTDTYRVRRCTDS